MFDRNHGYGKVQMSTEYKSPSISPFDFVNSVQFDKKDLIVDDWSERQYNPFIINKSLSFGADTVIQANEMNSRPHLDKKLQFDFLRNIIPAKKRYNKWLKGEKLEAIEIVKQYYGYNTVKAQEVVSILSHQQIDSLKQKLKKGGLKNG
jgi:hypothetical protein